jgi:cell division protein ZapE
MQTLRAGFDRAVLALGSVLDVEQEPVADRLALLGTQLDDRGRRRWGRRWRRRVPSGVYLHGAVGRGKTWLVDLLLAQLPAEGVLRLHAYEAARSLHRMFAQQSGAPGATDRAVDTLLDGVRLLFLDELHAHDPGDAMLLSRLVRARPARGAVLVATSNYPPQGLLPDPRHHALVLPLIAALQEHCDVLEVAEPVDHRAHGHGGARPRLVQRRLGPPRQRLPAHGARAEGPGRRRPGPPHRRRATAVGAGGGRPVRAVRLRRAVRRHDVGR